MSKEKKKNRSMGYRQKWKREEKKRKEIRLCIMTMPARVAK